MNMRNHPNYRLSKSLAAIVCAGLLAGSGCHDNSPYEGSKSDTRPASGPSIGPQFWKYDLSEYKLVDQDVVHGLGGRWISVQYQQKDGAALTRARIAERIIAALTADGWKPTPVPPPSKYVQSKIWHHSDKDLGFTRQSRGNEDEHWFFSQYIYISDDAKILCLYCEVGW